MADLFLLSEAQMRRIEPIAHLAFTELQDHRASVAVDAENVLQKWPVSKRVNSSRRRMMMQR